MPRPKIGAVKVEAHRDHYDIRFTLPDGAWTPRECQTPHVTKEAARREARRLCDVAWRHGAVVAREEPEAETGESMDRWFERWLAERKERGLTTTKDDDGRWRKWLFPMLGHRAVAAVQRIDLERVVEDLDRRVRAGELSWKTATHAWGLVSKMFSDASASKRLDLRVRADNPAAGVRGPDKGVTKAKSYLYPSELLAVVSCPTVPLRWRRLFALSVYTYTRPGELQALEWADVDLDRGTIHVHRAIGDDGEPKPTKTKVTRRIPIEPALSPLLATLKAEAGDAPGRLVPEWPPECELSSKLREYLGRAGVDRAELYASNRTQKQLRFYDLRATGITWMAIRGDEPLRIMQRAGHVEFSTTQGYIREAETLGDVGATFPPLPPLDGAPDTQASRGRLGGLARARNLPKYPSQSGVSVGNFAIPAGIEPALPA